MQAEIWAGSKISNIVAAVLSMIANVYRHDHSASQSATLAEFAPRHGPSVPDLVLSYCRTRHDRSIAGVQSVGDLEGLVDGPRVETNIPAVMGGRSNREFSSDIIACPSEALALKLRPNRRLFHQGEQTSRISDTL